jgi:hypothetical protein
MLLLFVVTDAIHKQFSLYSIIGYSISFVVLIISLIIAIGIKDK